MGIAMDIEHSGGTGMHKKNGFFKNVCKEKLGKIEKKILQINEETLHCFFHFSADFGFNRLEPL